MTTTTPAASGQPGGTWPQGTTILNLLVERDDLVDSAAATYSSADPAKVVDALEQHANRLAQLAEDAGLARLAK